MKYLPMIKSYTDFQQIPKEAYPVLAAEIREFLCQLATQKEIHFSSNLGIVETTIALLNNFDLTQDLMLWDTGHQTYVQKILTGRGEQLKNIRTFDGPAGLMERNESPFDHYSPGHSGNTLSVLMGMSQAPKRYNVLVIGDAGLTNGITMEALNHLGALQTPVIIVLNDNGMSISEAVGGFHLHMQKTNFRDEANVLHNFFAAMGIQYLGVIDGHHFDALDQAFTTAKEKVQNGPVFVHIHTVKGKGLLNAEMDRDGTFHSSSLKKKAQFGSVVKNYLKELSTIDPTVRIVNPAMSFGTDMVELATKPFYFDPGIAEEHAVSYASGMALAGFNVFVVIYSTFLQRAYDQLVHDCSRLNLKLTFLLDRADMSGGDGPSHHGIFDVGFLKSVPNTIITSPRNFAQLQQLLNFANAAPHGLWFIRYPKSPFTNDSQPTKLTDQFRWEWLKTTTKNKICLVTYGPYTDVLMNKIQEFSLPCDVVNAVFINKYNQDELAKLFKKYRTVICYERIWNGSLVNDLYKYAQEHHKQTKIIAMNYTDVLHRGETDKIDQANKMHWQDVVDQIRKAENE